MNLHEAIQRLDDASGELALTFSKLDMERQRGLTNRLEEADFLEDLRQAAQVRVLRPWKRRWTLSLVLAGVLSAGAGLSTWGGEALHGLALAAGIAGLAGILAAVGSYRVYRNRSLDLERRYQGLRSAMDHGASLLDLGDSTAWIWP